VATGKTGSQAHGQKRDHGTVMMELYRDSYLFARAVTAIGQLIRSVAAGLTVLVFVFAVVVGIQEADFWRWAAGGLLAGLSIGIPIYVLGILVSAHGQVLKATLDSAVHSSPFLSPNQVAKIMSLE
jgi:hypothetical protein